MTLDKITTPFRRRRVIEYGADGNKVVRHWYDVQHVTGSVYKSRNIKNDWGELEFSLFIFFGDAKSDGLMFQRKMKHPDWYTVEKISESARQYGLDTPPHMYADLETRVNNKKFIGNAEIEFIRQFDPTVADQFAKYRKDYYARKEVAERERRRVLEEQEVAEKARQQAELEAAKAKYLGWADTMSPMRFGKVDAVLGSLVRCDGKVMTRREFVVQAVRDGWIPEQRDGVTRQGKPRTEYRLVRENFSYTVSKTEFDFAKYYVEHREV